MIEVSWANPEKTIIDWRFATPWTWAQFDAALAEANSMTDEVDYVVDNLIHTSKEQVMPPNAIVNLRKLIANRHDRSGIFVVIRARTIVSSLLSIIMMAVPGLTSVFYFAKNEAEAMEMIAEAQASRQAAHALPS